MDYPHDPSDLSDAEWEKVYPLLLPEKPIGKQQEVDLRDCAQCYLLSS